MSEDILNGIVRGKTGRVEFVIGTPQRDYLPDERLEFMRQLGREYGEKFYGAWLPPDTPEFSRLERWQKYVAKLGIDAASQYSLGDEIIRTASKIIHEPRQFVHELEQLEWKYIAQTGDANMLTPRQERLRSHLIRVRIHMDTIVDRIIYRAELATNNLPTKNGSVR